MTDTVLFDLDGTLSDSAPGILAALRHAFAVNDVPPLDADAERELLGPPFAVSLPPHLGDPAKLPAVIAAYRAQYGSGGMYDTSLFPGVEDVLGAASRAGLRLAVATSKPEHYALPVIEHLGLSHWFTTIGGDELDGSRGTKALVIAEVLRRLGDPDPATVLMVGDREHDVLGARAHDIRCIGVRWGYASPGELERAGADPICATPAELAAALGLTDVAAT